MNAIFGQEQIPSVILSFHFDYFRRGVRTRLKENERAGGLDRNTVRLTPSVAVHSAGRMPDEFLKGVLDRLRQKEWKATLNKPLWK